MKFLALLFFAFYSLSAEAQLKGEIILGDVGLQAGTQAEPSVSVFVPMYFYKTTRLKNGSGDVIAENFALNSFYTGIGSSVVLKKKILQAHWGSTILIPFIKNRIEAIEVNDNPSLGFTDIFLQPLQLGWHTKRADFVAGYSLYFPTGKYELGGSENTGMGMWINEFSAGTTVYFDSVKTWHISALLFYDIHSKKKDTEIKPGHILTVKGGAGKTFYKKVKNPVPMIFNAGVVYGMQFKITDDEFPVSLDLTKDHVYALGLEGSMYIPFTNTLVGFRWEGEVGARNRFQGNNFFVTIAQVLKTF